MNHQRKKTSESVWQHKIELVTSSWSFLFLITISIKETRFKNKEGWIFWEFLIIFFQNISFPKEFLECISASTTRSFFISNSILDTRYKRWGDYRGGDNTCPRDSRCKVILYWIFLIKTSLIKQRVYFLR